MGNRLIAACKEKDAEEMGPRKKKRVTAGQKALTELDEKKAASDESGSEEVRIVQDAEPTSEGKETPQDVDAPATKKARRDSEEPRGTDNVSTGAKAKKSKKKKNV